MIRGAIKGKYGTLLFVNGLLIRIGIAVLFPVLFDDGVLLKGVKYTDIDYQVFTDAARHVSHGSSPYNRHTYRYSPFIAKVLSFADDESSGILNWWRNHKYFGKILFCVADAVCGLLILNLRRRRRDMNCVKDPQLISDQLLDALWWLYNPIPINICTRGSAESFLVLLFVLVTVAITLSETTSSSELRLKSIFSGMMHGLAVHGKLYPIIYTISFMVYFSRREYILNAGAGGSFKRTNLIWRNQISPLVKNGYSYTKENEKYPFPWFNFSRFNHLITLWIHRLLSSTSILFGISFAFSFGLLTYASVHFYGPQALTEGLLYHFSRVDHRHNYSMFWYWIYLARGRMANKMGVTASSSLSFMGRSLLLPQIFLILYSSFGIAPYDLEFALFLQTFLFVAMNKVITAQYFTWYLVLLPLCSERICWRAKDQYVSLAALGLSTVGWLISAFSLEMKGMSSHLIVWIASICFFFGNLNLFRTICSNYNTEKGAFRTLEEERKLKRS